MQPVKMTRAEYEAKYGVKPVISTSTLDTTPAPIRMTRQEYQDTYGVKPTGGKPETNWAVENLSPFSQTNVNRLKDIPSDIKESFQGLQDTAKETNSSIGQLWSDPNANIVQKVVGTGLAPVSGGLTMAAQAAMAPVKVLTTDEFEKAFISKLGQGIEGVKESGVGQWFKEKYDELDPGAKVTLSKILAPAANIITSVSTAGAAPGVIKKGLDVAEEAVKVVPDIATTLKEVQIPFTKTPDQRIANVASEIGKVEEKYAPIRKANQYSKDVEGSRTRIAQSNVLENAVDSNGTLQTSDAIKAYKAQTIDGMEDVVRKNLENEGKTVNLQELKSEMEIALLDSGLEGSDLATALSGIEKELKGLAVRADELGEVPLTKVQDAKISTTNNINFNTPPETATYRKTLARVYKEMIENKSDLDVKKVNSELAKYYGDIERLERLNGRKVEGGRLGKYTASLAGTAIGMGAGSVGGGFGAAVGGILGGEAAVALKGKSMAGTMRGGGAGLPENKILQEAKARAEIGNVTNLKVPDKKVGAPKDIVKTKEVKKIEGQIAKNIDLQKKAIKAGDFALVAKLKEIYTFLVEKLKAEVRFIRENITDQGGYARNPFVKDDGQSIPLQRNQRNTTTPASTNSISSTVPKLDAEVKSNIVRILDDYTLNKNPDLELQMDAAKIAEDLGIKLPKTYGELVKKLGEVLDVAEAPKTVNTPNLADDIAKAKAEGKAQKYKTTVNIQDKDDLAYLGQILSRDAISDIQAGKMENWRGTSYEDLAKVNIVSETPLTIAQKLEGKVKDFKIPSDTFYHGTSAESADAIMSGGFKTGKQLPTNAYRGGGYGNVQNSISVAETPKDASTFSDLTKGGKIIEIKLKPDAKVVTIEGVEDAIELEDYINYLRKEKVDAVYIGGGEKELVVLNPKAIKPTRSQLKAEWDKAK